METPYFLFIFLFFELLSLVSPAVIPVSRMDCHTVYELDSGFKPLSIEIEGLRRNIEVVLTDREIEKSKCGRKVLEGRDFCSNSSQFCRGT